MAVSSSVEIYYSHLKPKTVDVTRRHLDRWLNWMRANGGAFSEMTPDQLVEYQEAAQGRRRYDILDLIQRYVDAQDWRAGTKTRAYSALTNFFNHNRAEVPADKRYRIKSDRPAVEGKLAVEHIQKMAVAGNVMYRAMILSMFSGGMGIGEVIDWSNRGLDELREDLKRGVHPIKISFPGRKKNRNLKPYYTFIGRDAEDALKAWLAKRPESKAGDAIFLSRYRTPLSIATAERYWIDKLKRVGIIEHRGLDPVNGDRLGTIRYGFNLHEFRDVYRSRWRPSGSDVEVAEFMMGHDLDRYGYDKSPKHYPDWFKQQYLKAEPWLNIVSADPTKVDASTVDDLRAQLAASEETRRREMAALNAKVDAALEARKRMKAT